jgi:FO synthase
MHVHAFSPMEIVNGAAKTGMTVREWLIGAKAAGLDTIPEQRRRFSTTKFVGS